MKTIVNKFFVLVIYMLGLVNIYAAPHPPMPTGKKVPPPGLPIDENLPVLLIIAILFGIYIVYNQFLKQKFNTNLDFLLRIIWKHICQ